MLLRRNSNLQQKQHDSTTTMNKNININAKNILFVTKNKIEAKIQDAHEKRLYYRKQTPYQMHIVELLNEEIATLRWVLKLIEETTREDIKK